MYIYIYIYDTYIYGNHEIIDILYIDINIIYIVKI